jgi:hypothetical protein
MILDKPLEEIEARPAAPLAVPAGSAVYGLVLGLMILIGGVAWNPISTASDKGVADFRRPGPAIVPKGGAGMPPGMGPPKGPKDPGPGGEQPKGKRKEDND